MVMGVDIQDRERERERPALKMVLENTRPVDVTDLGRALEAFGREYEEFVVGRFEPPPVNARLYITSLETGSIIVELQTLLDQASFIVNAIDVFAGFVTNLQDIIDFLLLQDKEKKPHSITNTSVENISTFVEPIAKDGGSNVTITVNIAGGSTAPVVIQPVVINSERANAIQNGARRFLGSALPTNGIFKNELLQLHQMRGDAKAKQGDRGIIEKFSMKPVKLHFMTPEVKASILDKPDNPFKLAYLVDGEVSTIGGQPGLYKIYEVHDAIEKPKEVVPDFTGQQSSNVRPSPDS
jgi:hypothetical protein